MSDVLTAAGLAGALLCLAGHLPGPVHRWGPQVVALGGMALTAGGRPASGTCAVGAACLWSVVRACAERRGWTGSLDLAAMTLLMALMAGGTGFGDPHPHMTAMAVGGDRPIGAAAVLTVVVWVTARAGGVLLRQVSSPSPAPSPTTSPAPPSRRTRAYREAGAALMMVSMAAMLV
ncbi:hypothetical protein [Streptomyces griseiscabiei]|uniref:Integral membrane protein n=1 Tax=Streptomyces griseiscabiei TaxID=2993540 RepID=A0ABU4L6C7_9ACTN|nr:hypothetical protein [Streptomyces griseiscabiei]MBZ3906348.1 hypothetical protein [Streptomyces griseiscabiei]MDX2911345.1 hypothetical protein [Streptomyces griseiscabiei]